jgi:hypothetical protein
LHLLGFAWEQVVTTPSVADRQSSKANFAMGHW